MPAQNLVQARKHLQAKKLEAQINQNDIYKCVVVTKIEIHDSDDRHYC
jgi:hypothetical protein